MGGGDSKPTIEKDNLAWLKELYSEIHLYNYDVHEFNSKVIGELLKVPYGKLIISSIGKQSLGKSFFLNTMFGSGFETKKNIGNGKCTVNANSKDCGEFYLMDFEGIDSNVNTNKRENANTTLALAFSQITLFHVGYIDMETKLTDRFAFTYWLAIKKMKSEGYKNLAKVVLVIRNYEPDTDMDDGSIKKDLEEKVKTFKNEINSKIKEINQMYESIFLRDKKLKNKDEIIQKLVPNDEEYMFDISYFIPVFWDTSNKKYKSYGNKNFENFNIEQFRNNLMNLAKKIKGEPKSVLHQDVPERHNEVSKVAGLNDHLINLNSIRNDLELYLNQGSLQEYQFRKFALSIELDFYYCSLEFSELEQAIKKIELITEQHQNEEIEKMECLKNKVENIEESKSNHSQSLEKIFENAGCKIIKVRVLESLIINTATNYANVLGLLSIPVIINSFDANLSKQFEIQLKDFKQKNEENFLVFMLEVILCYSGPDYQQFTENEFNKIIDARKFFKACCYFDKVEECYIEILFKPKKNNFYVFIFYTLKERIDQIFENEILKKVNIEETERKIQLLNWELMKSEIEKLIGILELPILKEFRDFYEKMKIYFKNYIRMIVFEAREFYFESTDERYVFSEVSHYLMKKNINLLTITGGIIMLSGNAAFCVTATVIVADLSIVAVETAEVIALGTLLAVSGVVFVIFVAQIALGYCVYKFLNYKLKARKGLIGSFEDNFRSGKELIKDFKIDTVELRNKILNCQFIQSYPKYKKGLLGGFYYEIELERKNEGNLSGVVYCYYTVKGTVNTPAMKIDEVQRRLQALLRIS